MTHDELLDKIEAIDYWQGHFANKTFLKTLIAVLELHIPFHDQVIDCVACGKEYPCPTIQAIDNALRS